MASWLCGASCTLGSLTATPSISPCVSCSAAASAAPAPLETLEAITMVLAGPNRTGLLPSGLGAAKRSLSTQRANCTARSVSRPQSFSGFCCECACLTAKRLGVAVLKAVRSASVIAAVKMELRPAAAASARTPFCRLTVLFCRSCTPSPVPLSV